MPRFFSTDIFDNHIRISGNDAHHIGKALRMRIGEELTVCDQNGTDYVGVIESISPQEVILKITSSTPTVAEPSIAITLYQGLPKSDKMDWIVQKSVELGVSRIVPVVTSRSISRTDSDKGDKKRDRWQKIAAEAAGQSGRGRIPVVSSPLTWKQMMQEIPRDNALIFYEGGGKPLTSLITPDMTELAIIVGPEGGFAPEEVAALQDIGVVSATLGKRILRCETAPIAALSAILCLSGNMG